MTTTSPDELAYHVCLYVGQTPPQVHPGTKVINLTPQAPTVDAIKDVIEKATITPSDLRSRVLFFCADNNYRDHALAVYAFLTAFAHRRLDAAFSLDDTPIALGELDKSIRSLPTVTRPELPVADVQIGGTPQPDVTHVQLTGAPTVEQITLIRFARNLHFVAPPETGTALQQFIALSAIRARGTHEKFPILTHDPASEPEEPTAIYLDRIRMAGEEARQSLRSDNREAIAEVAENKIFERFQEADQVPMEKTLTRLGAKCQSVEQPVKNPREGEPETITVELWHCPRPERHTNGDANPSARITVKNEKEYFQCFRCDKERIGPLRLTMDVRGMTGVEATQWLTGKSPV